MFLPFETFTLSNLVTAKQQVQKLSKSHKKKHDLTGLLAVVINSFNYEFTNDFSKTSTRLGRRSQVFLYHRLILMTKTSPLMPSSPLLPYRIALQVSIVLRRTTNLSRIFLVVSNEMH